MTELLCLEIAMVLWLAHVLAQALTARAEFGDDYLFSPRDAKMPVKGLMLGRATRALSNYIENLVPFVALDLALIVTDQTGGWGATIWIVARIAYLPIYMMGIKYVRTGCWVVSLVGLGMMLVRLM